jgi:hypothetical protein
MIKYISVFGLCFFTCVSYASSILNVKLENESTLNIQKGKYIKKIILGKINGYKINCNENYLAVWGRAKKFNENSPQNNEIIFLNLKTKKQRTIDTSHAIFDVDFYKSAEKAIVSLINTNTIINLRTGKESDIPEIDDVTLKKVDDCNNIIQFKRYK